MSDHFELSPSSAHRWMRCPGSVALSRGIEDRGSEAADEGTLAHSIAAEVLIDSHILKHKNSIANHPAAKDLEFICAGNIEALQSYVDFVESHTAGNAWRFVEVKLDLGQWIGEGGFGTADAVIYKPEDRVLTIIDLKFGRGNLVYANDHHGDTLELNPQLATYGLGAHEMFKFLDITDIELIIHQPRRDHTSVALTTPERLLEFGDRLSAAVSRVYAEPGTYVPSDKACQWCPARASCDARARWHLEAFQQEIALLTPEQVSLLLAQVGDMRSWCDDLESMAMSLLMRDRAAVPGWKVVSGRGTRQWTENAAHVLIHEHGIVPFEQKMLGLGAIEKLLGKDRAPEVMPTITVKAPGKPTLAKATDPRPPIEDSLDGFTVETGD
jgi:Protein of unknown function (DUF2800)